VTSDEVLDPAAVATLLDLAGGDLDFVDEIADTYREDTPVQLATITAAVEAGDASALVAPAHTLKSSSASVGAMRVAALAQELEALARSGDVPDGTSRLDALRQEYALAEEALQARPWRAAS
jgi:HPt (histidine-containing phosphotransfer) domain-containing protein